MNCRRKAILNLPKFADALPGPIPINEKREAKASPVSLVSRRGIEPLSTDSESGTLSVELTGHVRGPASRPADSGGTKAAAVLSFHPAADPAHLP